MARCHNKPRGRDRITLLMCIVFVVAVVMYLSVGSAMAGSGRTKLVFWAYGTMPSYLKEIKADFEAKNPDIELVVEVLGAYDVGEKLLTAMAAGTGVPDVVQMISRRFALFAQSGGLADMTKFTQDAGLYDKLMPEIVASASYNGKLYGVPIDVSPSMVFYRKDIFAQHGLDTDHVWSTWDNLLEAAKKLREEGYYTFNLYVPAGQWGSNFFTQFLMSRGCNIFDDDGKVIRNNTLAAETLQWIYDLKFKHDVAYTEVFFTAEHWNTLAGDEVLTYMIGPWGETHITEYATTEQGKWGIRPFPAWDNTEQQWTGQWGGITLAIPRLAKSKAAAQKLVSYILSDGERMFKKVSCIIPTKDAFSKPFLMEVTPLTGQPMGPVLSAKTVFPFNFTDWAQTEQILGNAIDSMFAEKKNPLEVWADIEKQLINDLGR